MRRFLVIISLLATTSVVAQSPLLDTFKVPEGVETERVVVLDVAEGATREQIQAVVDRAIELCSDEQGVRVRFAPNATYYVSREGVGQPIFEIHSREGGKVARNIEFDGQGCKFIINSQSRFMVFRDAEDVVAKNFTIDYDIRYITQGTVAEVDSAKNEYTFEVDTPYFYGTHPSYDNAQYRWVIPMEQQSDGEWGIVPSLPATIYLLNPHIPISLGENRYRARLRASIDHGRWHGSYTEDKWLEEVLPVGRKVAFTARRDAINIFMVLGCKRVTVRDMVVLHSPAAIASDNYSTTSCYYNIVAKPADGEIFTSTADGIYVTNQRNGPWIEKCDLRGLGDDVIVVKNFISRYAGQSDNSELPYRFEGGKSGGHNSTVEMFEGDEILFFDMKSRQMISQHRVVASSSDRVSSSVEVALSPAISDPRITPEAENVWCYNLSNQCNGFVVKDCKFADHRRWGILCSGADGSIVGNSFVRSQMNAIYMVNSDNYEMNVTGAPPRNIEIRNNYFERCWEGINLCPNGVISTRINGFIKDTREENILGDDPNDWNGVSNILISNNTFRNWKLCRPQPNGGSVDIYAIELRDVDGVIIENNRFYVEGERLNKENTIRAIDAKNVEYRGKNRFNRQKKREI